MADDVAAFVKERNEMLLSASVERAKVFHRKYNPGVALPVDAVVEIGLHKARTAATSLPQAERERSRQWLVERGYSSLE